MDNSIDYLSTFDSSKLKKQIQDQTQNVIETRLLNAVDKLQRSSPVGVSKQIGSPDLKSGWDLEIEGFRSGEYVAQIVNRAPASLNRLEGRKAGKRPPIDALLPFVQLKMGIGSFGKARQIAFLIARSIGKNGTFRSKRSFREFDPSTGQPAANGAIAIATRQIKKDLNNIIIG
jgi:hypothetical protein